MNEDANARGERCCIEIVGAKDVGVSTQLGIESGAAHDIVREEGSRDTLVPEV